MALQLSGATATATAIATVAPLPPLLLQLSNVHGTSVTNVHRTSVVTLAKDEETMDDPSERSSSRTGNNYSKHGHTYLSINFWRLCGLSMKGF